MAPLTLIVMRSAVESPPVTANRAAAAASRAALRRAVSATSSFFRKIAACIPGEKASSGAPVNVRGSLPPKNVGAVAAVDVVVVLLKLFHVLES